MVAEADWNLLLDGERELVHPVAGLIFCTSVHESSRTDSFVSLFTLYRVRIHATCLIVHGSIGECVVTSKDGILSLRTARYVLASSRTVDKVAKECVVLRDKTGKFYDKYHRHRAIRAMEQRRKQSPIVTEELLFLHVDRSVHTPGHAPTLLLPQQHRACPSSWSRAPTSRGWLQKRCLLPRGSTRSAEGLRHPCTRSQTEVVAASIFDCSRCGESRPRDSTHILHQGWLGKCVRLCCSITI